MPQTQVVGDLGADWNAGIFHKYGKHVSAAMLLGECGLGLIDKHCRPFEVFFDDTDADYEMSN